MNTLTNTIIWLVLHYTTSAAVNRSYITSSRQLQQSNLPPLLHSPAVDYPPFKSLLTVLSDWNPDIPDIPENYKETIQSFNYSDPIERLIATRFRDAEVPFKVYDVPDVDDVVAKWSDSYLLDMLSGDKDINTITSKSNHFMYYRHSKEKRSMDPSKRPTGRSDMTFAQWLHIARKADIDKPESNTDHFYFRKNNPAGINKRKSTFVGRDLGFFTTKTSNFFITNVAANKGIQCRFGMRGIIAESHYDSGRNMVAMLKGAKRYVLSPPESCRFLGIISDPSHPSFRHSIIDWSDIRQARASGFDQAQAIDTIVRTGEVLYIPSYWFHYIVSLNYSIQCNSRSGTPPSQKGKNQITSCLRLNK